MNRNIRRTLCILLALVLMSSSAVSYTFAEYARGSELIDNSRATIWGVNVDVTGSAFATKYVGKESIAAIDLSVKSSTYGQDDADNILAPGTTGTFTGISCTGSPEVSVDIVVNANLQLSNWVVNGSYYCPLVININGVDYDGRDYSSSLAFEEAIEAAIEKASGTYPPNTNLSEVTDLNGSYTWTWDFGSISANDTALAGRAKVALSVSCSVYQTGGENIEPGPDPEPDPDDGLTDDDEFDASDKGPIIWL